MRIKMAKRLITAISMGALVTLSQLSQAGIIGNDAVNRATSDGWSNFVLGLTTETFTTAGTVTNWNVYTNNAGSLGMLLLRNTGANNYTVIGADFESVSAGLNSFTFNADTGSSNVLAGDILGLYIGSAKVDFDYNSNNDIVNWCGNNGCVSNLSQLDAGQSLTLSGGPQGRSYSANVSVAVSEPSTIALFGLSLLGLGFARRQSKA